MMELKPTPAHEQCLRDQVITAGQPGSALHDFGMLLDFLGPKGVESGGKYNLLPIKAIPALDERLSRPLHLNLKRPQIRSHPYLQGLNLLLRASGLTCVEGVGAKARLVIDPAMRMQWDQLNPTEQYFNLLEAWLLIGRSEMVGESGHWDAPLLGGCLRAWRSIPQSHRRRDPSKPHVVHLDGIYRELYQLALMDLFGLVEVKQPPRSVTTWGPAAVNCVPFGDAVFTLLQSEFLRDLGDFGLARPADEPEEVPDEDEDEEEDWEPEVPVFGLWQSLFQPYFPEWRENLVFPKPERREGTFIFRVTVHQEIWRLIAIPAGATLDDLVGCILKSVKFDDEHLYEFTYLDRRGIRAKAVHPEIDSGPWADQMLVGTLPLEPGQLMDLHYDFGDDWHFTVKLERIEPPDARLKKPRILESSGKAPKQYEREWF